MAENTTSTANSPPPPEGLYAAWTCMTGSPWECTKNYVIGKISTFTYGTAKWAAFQGSDYAAWGAGKLAVGTAKTIASAALSIPEWAMTKAFPITQPAFDAIRNKTGEVYDHVAETFIQWDASATDYIAPNAKALYEKKIQELIPGDTDPVMFSASTLCGPALLLGLCVKKTRVNALDALRHFRLLVTGKRQEVVSFKTPVYNNNMQKETSVNFFRNNNYTTAGLIKDTFFETGFALLWAKGARTTYDALFDALKDAGNSDSDAKTVVNAILIGVTVAPILYKWVKQAALEPHDPDRDQSPSTGPFGAKVALPAYIKEAMDKVGWPDRLKLNPYEGLSPTPAPAA